MSPHSLGANVDLIYTGGEPMQGKLKIDKSILNSGKCKFPFQQRNT